MTLIKAAILKNESEDSHLLWLKACSNIPEKVGYEIIDLTKESWMERIQEYNPDILLTRPGGLTSPFKQLYDERLMILVKELSYLAFPSLDEILIYENKRYFSYWLKAHKIPHPQTRVYYSKKEAFSFLKEAVYPLVAKVNIGASGSGVILLQSIKQAEEYSDRTFSGKGAAKRSGPNLKKKKLFMRGLQYIFHPDRISKKLKTYNMRASDVQKDFVLFQDFIPHTFEWRVVRIGDSFFAHKKLVNNGKASGSLLKKYDNPPLAILDFVRELTNRFGFFSQAVDIFETVDGYLVNEMQCIFGQSDPYQMLVNEIPGRYLYTNNNWFFEPGNFNTNESFDLRLEAALELYKKKLK